MSHSKSQRLDDNQADTLARAFNEDGFAGLHAYADLTLAALHEWVKIRDSISAATFSELRSEVVQLRKLVEAMKFSNDDNERLKKMVVECDRINIESQGELHRSDAKIAKVRAALIKMHGEVTSDCRSGLVLQGCRDMIATLSDNIIDMKFQI